MRFYLAGAMTKMPFYNREAFNEAAAKLREQGHYVVSPIEMDIEKYGEDIHNSPTGDPNDALAKGFDAGETLLADLTVILRDVDAIALLPGWENSRGANLEKAWAEYLGRKVIFL